MPQNVNTTDTFVTVWRAFRVYYFNLVLPGNIFIPACLMPATNKTIRGCRVSLNLAYFSRKLCVKLRFRLFLMNPVEGVVDVYFVKEIPLQKQFSSKL